MCGITGVWGVPAGHVPQDVVAAMVAALAHRGPDGTGEWTSPDGPTLGHCRLAVLDTSSLAAQPMVSSSGRWVVAYNGELYNHRELRHELAGGGRQFRSHGDTATLVEAIDAWGVEATLHRTNGMFAFAAYDREEQRLVLARDRLGEKPIYWALHEGRLAFASELKSLRRVPGLPCDIDDGAAGAVLRWGFIPGSGTIHRGIRRLGAGCLVEARRRDGAVVVEERQWWSLPDVVAGAVRQRTHTSLRDAAAELEPLLADAVRMRLESDVPLGSFLSGGIDSSLVAAFAQEALGGTLRTFTVAMPEFGFDESRPAAAVASHLGTHHTQVELSAADALAAVPELPVVWDEPFADPSMLPSLLLCRAARRELTVCLAGDGGDEVFAGYNRHALGARLWHRTSPLPRFVRRGLARAVLAPTPSTMDRWALRAGRILPEHLRLMNMGDKAQKAAAVLRGDGDGMWAGLAQVWPLSALSGRGAAPDLAVVDGLDPVERVMLADTAVVLPDQMLVKVDRASMAASLEVRSPFLDHRLLEWAWRQPLAVRTKGGVGKLVLREVLRGRVPADIPERPKMGFDPPLATWLRGPLRAWAGDLLADPVAVQRGWLAADALERTWREHQDGTRNHDYRLWAVLSLESWWQTYQRTA